MKPFGGCFNHQADYREMIPSNREMRGSYTFRIPTENVKDFLLRLRSGLHTITPTISMGCSSSSVDEKPFRNPLFRACREGKLKTVKYLVEYTRADVNVVAPNSGRCAIHLACRHGHLEIVKVLLNHGACVNAVSLKGWSPCHVSSLEGNYAMTELLIKHGAALDLSTKNGKTPLDLAKAVYRLEVADLLTREMKWRRRRLFVYILSQYMKTCPDNTFAICRVLQATDTQRLIASFL